MEFDVANVTLKYLLVTTAKMIKSMSYLKLWELRVVFIEVVGVI